MKFSIKDFLGNCEDCGFGHIYWINLCGKLHFLYSGVVGWINFLSYDIYTQFKYLWKNWTSKPQAITNYCYWGNAENGCEKFLFDMKWGICSRYETLSTEKHKRNADFTFSYVYPYITYIIHIFSLLNCF